ncbi:hypothetical protein EPN87_02510 [archaeon]|nr:MAG: hypothetical protein EPN87_02510 [archaeon]
MTFVLRTIWYQLHPNKGVASTGKYVTDVTGTTFDREVLKSPLPTLVDFWSPHCTPC